MKNSKNCLGNKPEFQNIYTVVQINSIECGCGNNISGTGIWRQTENQLYSIEFEV